MMKRVDHWMISLGINQDLTKLAQGYQRLLAIRTGPCNIADPVWSDPVLKDLILQDSLVH